MLKTIPLPSFGSSVGEATLVQWLVEPGSEVTAGQLLAEIETDKAMAELEAPEDGVIESIEVPEGTENVEVGAILAMLRVEADAEAGDTEALEEKGESGDPDKARATSTPAANTSGEAAFGDASNSQPETDSDGASVVRASRIMASPYARTIAGERGVSLEGLSGSGPAGRIVSRDIPRETAATTESAGARLESLGFSPDRYRLTPLDAMRRAIARGLTHSVQTIPHYSLTADLHFDAVAEAREHHPAGAGDAPTVRPSINDYVIWACARSLEALPELNSSFTVEGIARHLDVNIGIAVAVDHGLVAPVIHRAESLTLQEIAEASRAMVALAREHALRTQHLAGATFTISNLGMLGVKSFTSILSEPQAAILSLGAVEQRPVVVDGKLGVARMATATLTCDHRVVDGAQGAAFLRNLNEHLQSPPQP